MQIWIIFILSLCHHVNSSPVELSDFNFASTIESSKMTVVKFYLPTCPHCIAFEPIYEAVSNEIAEIDDVEILMAQVSCSKYRDICREYDVNSVPKLKIFSKGQLKEIYTGDRRVEPIRTYLLDFYQSL